MKARRKPKSGSRARPVTPTQDTRTQRPQYSKNGWRCSKARRSAEPLAPEWRRLRQHCCAASRQAIMLSQRALYSARFAMSSKMFWRDSESPARSWTARTLPHGARPCGTIQDWYSLRLLPIRHCRSWISPRWRKLHILPALLSSWTMPLRHRHCSGRCNSAPIS